MGSNPILSAKDKRGNLLPLLSFAECYGPNPSFSRSENDKVLRRCVLPPLHSAQNRGSESLPRRHINNRAPWRPVIDIVKENGSNPSFSRSKNDMGLNYFRGFASIILRLFPESQRESAGKTVVTDGTHTGRSQQLCSAAFPINTTAPCPFPGQGAVWFAVTS